VEQEIILKQGEIFGDWADLLNKLIPSDILYHILFSLVDLFGLLLMWLYYKEHVSTVFHPAAYLYQARSIEWQALGFQRLWISTY
jgi:hypothetical protein